MTMETQQCPAHQWCMEIGKHKRSSCKSEKEEPLEETVLTTIEDACMINSTKFTSNTWIGDTGATSHMTNNDKGLTNVQVINQRIKMGNSKHMMATKKGTLPCTIKQANGKDVQCSLEVKVIPEIWCNLFSITVAMKKGFELSSKGMDVKIKKGSFKFIFDKIRQTTGGGFLMGVEIVPRSTNTAMINQNEAIKPRKMDIHAAHHMLGILLKLQL